MKVGFYAWNPFQIYQVESIAENIEGSEFIIERRKNINFESLFTTDFFSKLKNKYRIISRDEVPQLDTSFDVIVCQTEFGLMETLRNTKIIGMQYSMTKERHQFGPWRSLCDMNLVYGKYSYEKISPFSPAIMVGNPRYDRKFNGELDPNKIEKIKQNIDENKKTILYLPTWGPLASIDLFSKAIYDLGSNYNVISKVHHKTDSHEKDRKEYLKDLFGKEIFGASDDMLYLMSIADMVLSDYSGSIFDAIYNNIPVVLLQNDPEKHVGEEKFGLESIEYKLRDKIGPVANYPHELKSLVDNVFSGKLNFKDSNAELREICFSNAGNCGALAAGAIKNIDTIVGVRPTYQIYIRDLLLQKREDEEKKRKRMIKKNKLYTNIIIKLYTTILQNIYKRISLLFISITENLIAKDCSSVLRLKIASFFSNFISKEILKSRSERNFKLGNKILALNYSYLLFNRNLLYGFTQRIKLLEWYGLNKDIKGIIEFCYNLPIDKKGSLLSRIERAQEYLKINPLKIREMRDEVHQNIKMSMQKNNDNINYYKLIKILIANRWIEDAANVIQTVNIKKIDIFKKQIEAIVKNFGEWLFLNELANKNHSIIAIPDETLVFYNGQAGTIKELQPQKIIEFFIPPYFYTQKVTDEETRDRICAFLREMLNVLKCNNIAILPRHQFKLTDACPTGKWPTISYHTTGISNNWLHVKDAALLGYFSFDSLGYAGFSTLANMTSLPKEYEGAEKFQEVEKIWMQIQKDFVEKRISKYAQEGVSFLRTTRKFVFLPLQVITDSVSKLSYINELDLIDILAQVLPKLGYDLVIKRHPKCNEELIEKKLLELSAHQNIEIIDAPIFVILQKASAVVTVNSGVGLEALLYGKRVITTGAAEYAYATNVVKNSNELLDALTSLDNPVDLFKIKSFIHYYIKEFCVHYTDRKGIVDKINKLLMS